MMASYYSSTPLPSLPSNSSPIPPPPQINNAPPSDTKLADLDDGSGGCCGHAKWKREEIP